MECLSMPPKGRKKKRKQKKKKKIKEPQVFKITCLISIFLVLHEELWLLSLKPFERKIIHKVSYINFVPIFQELIPVLLRFFRRLG